MSRNSFFLTDMWKEIAAEHKPLLSYVNAGLPYEDWKKSAKEKLMELLGEFPENVDPEPEIESSVEQDGYIRERVVFNVDKYMAVPCVLLIPASRKPGEKLPAIVCSHGHGPYGKDPVAGVRGDAQHEAEIAKMNYNYAEKMVKEGFVTISPDLRGFGERHEYIAATSTGRDLCNINFNKGALFGIYTLTLNIWDIMKCIDYLETREEVDSERIGMMGLSYGGTVTTFASAVEPRIKAADIIGYVNPFASFAIRDSNYCGSQFVPNIYKYFDTYDIAGMIAPKPLLVEMGIYDHCFPFKDLSKGFEGIKTIYAAAGCQENLWSDIHPGGHAHSGVRAPEFFKKYL